MLNIERDIITGEYFIKSKLYKYIFSWEILQQERERLTIYYPEGNYEDWFSDIDKFTRKMIKRERI